MERVFAQFQTRGMPVQREAWDAYWSIDSLDWADPIPNSIANRVIGEAKKKGRGVIIFHDIHGRTAEALPAIIETLQAAGFRFVLWE